jgi:hypothetical protein
MSKKNGKMWCDKAAQHPMYNPFQCTPRLTLISAPSSFVRFSHSVYQSGVTQRVLCEKCQLTVFQRLEVHHASFKM